MAMTLVESQIADFYEPFWQAETALLFSRLLSSANGLTATEAEKRLKNGWPERYF
jgi:hypothetical protein